MIHLILKQQQDNIHLNKIRRQLQKYILLQGLGKLNKQSIIMLNRNHLYKQFHQQLMNMKQNQQGMLHMYYLLINNQLNRYILLEQYQNLNYKQQRQLNKEHKLQLHLSRIQKHKIQLKFNLHMKQHLMNMDYMSYFQKNNLMINKQQDNLILYLNKINKHH